MNRIMKVQGLCKANILNGVDFEMEQGEIVAIMGPSGSGKSTFLYQMSGMDKPDSGQIYFDGEDICGYSEDESAKMRLEKMGFVFQQMNMLANQTIIENILFPAMHCQKGKKEGKKNEKLKEKAMTLIKKVGIEGLEDRKITEVSGGQLQRACICRALMNEPLMLLADEPTGALNKSSSKEIMDEFVALNQGGMSTLIVTHDSKVASRCNRILYMLDGTIAGELVLGKYEEDKRQEREGQLGKWLEKQGW